MKFISPKTDFAFKKIFGSEQSHDVLISFLNAMLYDGQSRISQLEILNPYLAPRIRGVKDTYLDVKAKLDNGTSVIIEMQVLNIEGFEKRILYNAAKAYSIQLGIGQSYSQLNPVIALTITDFVMFPEINQLTSRFILKEKDFLIDYPIYDLELVFVELPKFDKALMVLETLADKWLYFLKHAIDLDVVPESMNLVPEIKQAFEFAREGNLSPEELDELQHQEFFIQDQHNAIVKALKQGLEQGKTEAMLEMAGKLLDVLDDDAISRATGLILTEFAELRSMRSQVQ
ncbi:Rpn family recombination-promoting nuclease/putative transposase [Pseudanabaena sp. UWO311]|uniref:Rpn family recombination-promoting nuclease/putative transposase n=1 Tax=Pseudanabaena sp. UWO311 TaxID=2487337 RepID=UPI0011589DD5|nr:Rpn family recombination-promoting nuclease/putative transposase [Pseudanabaena sp. UWO311]TYQ24823.1 Rpn family recombination-promoting nuclease/putative transposase [Pseudanabaena sp. UWO311]